MRGEKYGVSLELEFAQPHASTEDSKPRTAFVGEIAAILHLIETHDVVSILEKALDASDSAVALPNLTSRRSRSIRWMQPGLMSCHSQRRGRSPIFMRWLPRSKTTSPVPEGAAGSITERIRCVLTELNDALALGDDILRELRPLLSPKHQKSLTRA
jgi:hypothetical protein